MSGYWRPPVVGWTTNLGYVYCTAHGVEQPGALGVKAGVAHVVVHAIDDSGHAGERCDWPGCGATIPTGGKPTEWVDLSLHVNR